MAKPGSKRRGRMHDAEGAREAILNAGEEVFAEHGFDGARIDAIAKVSGYNKSLIFQYFGDKLGLYAAVIRRMDEETRSWQNEALKILSTTKVDQSLDQLKNLMAMYVGKYFDYLVERPQVARIYTWEMAEGWQTMSKIFTQRDFDDVDEFMPILTRLQEVGWLRSDPEPILQFTHALFTCTTYLSMPALYKSLLPGMDFSSPEALKYARDFVVDFVVNGLLVTPAKAKPRKK